MKSVFTYSKTTKNVSYNQTDFFIRYSKLVNLCKNAGLDGLLFIHGIDGRNNVESARLSNWLFDGKTGYQVQKSFYLPHDWNDCFFIIRSDSTSFFYLQESLFKKIETQVITLPNVKLYIPTEKELDDTDELQLTKIAQFYKHVEGLDKVGVLLGEEDGGKVKNIEKWPLIQAYGLEGIIIFLIP